MHSYYFPDHNIYESSITVKEEKKKKKAIAENYIL